MQIVSKFSTHIVKVPSSVLEVVPWHHLDNHFGVLDQWKHLGIGQILEIFFIHIHVTR